MLGLTVKDIPSSIDFYRLLGWNFSLPDDLGPYTEITLENGLRISLNQEDMVKSLHPEWLPPVGHRMGIAFLCESPDAVDALYSKIVGAGYEGLREPFDAFWGQRYAQVVDPDENIVDLFCPI